MPDYKEMYQTLFRSMTKATMILQEAQQVTEEMYLSAGLPDIRALNIMKPEGSTPDSGDKTLDKDK